MNLYLDYTFPTHLHSKPLTCRPTYFVRLSWRRPHRCGQYLLCISLHYRWASSQSINTPLWHLELARIGNSKMWQLWSDFSNCFTEHQVLPIISCSNCKIIQSATQQPVQWLVSFPKTYLICYLPCLPSEARRGHSNHSKVTSMEAVKTNVVFQQPHNSGSHVLSLFRQRQKAACQLGTSQYSSSEIRTWSTWKTHSEISKRITMLKSTMWAPHRALCTYREYQSPSFPSICTQDPQTSRTANTIYLPCLPKPWAF